MKTHKILYNTAFGGYGLSKIAISWMKKHIEDNSIDITSNENFNMYMADTGDNKDFWYGRIIDDIFPRHHKVYQDMIESIGYGDIEKGLELCSGPYCSLAFKEISSDRYYIDDYDGKETIITSDDFIKIF